MVMALVVLIGFGLLFMFAFDEGFQGGEQSIESVIAQQIKEISDYESSVANGRQSLEQAPMRLANTKELTRVKRENQSAAETITKLKDGITAGNAEIVSRNEAFDGYKDEYRTYVRGKAKGESMETLKTLTGAVYNKVNIREVTAIGIQIRHEEGQKRIPFEELPDEMKDHFQFDPNQKEKALASESATREAHEAAVAVASDIEDQQMDKQREKDAVQAKVRTRREIAAKEAQISSIQSEIQNLNSQMDRAAAEASAARSAGRMHINKSSGISGNIRAKQNRISALRAEVSQLKSAL